ncbi:MAG: circularly permuted type 2 ATP-grasp protein [Planctomycetes bacterium]|nr:circularly permuted type 2 ATP-grasp protein [Planctomycetota bacterium]
MMQPPDQVASTASWPREDSAAAGLDPGQRLATTARWDESRGADGAWRPEWQQLFAHFESLGSGEIDRRREQCGRLLREHGIAFDRFRDRAASERPWTLDLLPLLIAASEWRTLAAGVAQRARALDAWLADAYGERRLIREGVLPPGLLYGHPHYLRPLVGVPVVGDARLLLYACELVRLADGSWRVTADLCQAPPGLGYALEHRLLVSRSLPESFRALRVQRLAGFFMTLRRSLHERVPRVTDNPRIVMLTAGPRAETYFEQAFLAQYLGYSLVQGDDLTVREGRVWMKTLTGLKPVEAIVRRVVDDWCDPLELNNESMIGVPGLVDAVRQRAVTVVNALGSGLADSPALLPYVERLIERLLGERPLLASADAWWGGEESTTILEQLPALILRPAWNNRGRPVIVGDLSRQERQRLAEDIAARPHAYVGYRPLSRSLVPCWTAGRLVQRTMSLRLFACRDGEGYAVMPGGLVRVDDDDSGALWFESGSGAKDAWVLADAPVAEISLLPPPDRPLAIVRGGIDLPSRVADNLFWLGRYTERTEDLVRLLRAALAQLAEDPDAAEQARIAACLTMLQRACNTAIPEGTPSAALVALLSGGIGSVMRQLRDHMRRTAFGVRDRLSADTWRALTALDLEIAPEGAEDANQALTRLNRVVLACAAIAGMGAENTTRGPGWRFLDLGRRLERAIFTVDCLRAAYADGVVKTSELEMLLVAADSALTYRARYLTTLQAAPVVDLLLTDATNPRAVAYQTERIVDLVEQLPRDGERALPLPAERLAHRIATQVRIADPVALCDPARGAAMQDFLDDLARSLAQLSDAISTGWLTLVTPTRQLAGEPSRER